MGPDGSAEIIRKILTGRSVVECRMEDIEVMTHRIFKLCKRAIVHEGGLHRYVADRRSAKPVAGHWDRHPREILGLGRATTLDWLEGKWSGPNRKTERFAAVPLDRYIVLIEGKGISH